jgi:8-oxo-dGTP pyrophosphatase MutT (NUDIX family)
VTKDHVPTPRRSAGVVVVRRHPDGWRCLLLRSFRYWDFPKGLVEAGEAPLAAARREVEEETGLADLAFRWGESFHETAPYLGGKVARYYVAESARGEVRLPVSPELGRAEHNEFRWLRFDAARELLVPRVQAALDWARKLVEASG